MPRKVSRLHLKKLLSLQYSLNATDVQAQRLKYGDNDLIGIPLNRWLELGKDTIKDPMIWFLLGTSFLFILLKNYQQSLILFLATIPLIGMDAYLHWRTQASTRSLSSHLATSAVVWRDGVKQTVPLRDLVPDDLVLVAAGMIFPADGILIAGHNIQVDESVLTGEAFPVSKQIFNDLELQYVESKSESQHWGFAGTRLLTGEAFLRVIYTGPDTLYGGIVNLALQTTHERTPLQKAIARLVAALIGIATISCVILAVIRYLQGFGIIDAILSAATLAVAALPDEFPVVFTFFLGIGVYRLAKQKALVRRAVSVENIGRVSCICSDKTGTLTEGKFQLTQCCPTRGYCEQRLIYLAAIASRHESGDPLDAAITDVAQTQNVVIPARLMTFPFTEERKRETSAIVQQDNRLLFATKGSPEVIISLCQFTEEERTYWSQRTEELAATGCKVIACAQFLDIASRANTILDSDLKEPVDNYQFVGLLGFTDPPRAEVPAAIQRCLANNIRVLMITGDHPETARAIARQIGLHSAQDNVILAQQMVAASPLRPEQLSHIDVVARATPVQKLDIVRALRAQGNIVAVTGDGVNDVPALKAADIGIAMGKRGTQSAREIADIVLMDDNFTNIVNAIDEGKQLFKNLKLSFKYLLIIHAPFVISAAVIPLMGYPLIYYPIHIVWIELFIHPTSMLVFQDLPERGKQPLATAHFHQKISFFVRRDWWGIGICSTVLTTCIIAAFILLFEQGHPMTQARAFVLAALGVASSALTAGLSRLHTIIARVIAGGTLVITFLLIQMSSVAKFLYIMPLSMGQWLTLCVLGFAAYLLAKI